MKLAYLRIQNFKGIRDLELDFRDDLDNIRLLTLLVGPNGSGKTSILEAIWFGLAYAPKGEEYPQPSFNPNPEYTVRSGSSFASFEFILNFEPYDSHILEEKPQLAPYINFDAINFQEPFHLGWTYPAQEGYKTPTSKKGGGYKLINNAIWGSFYHLMPELHFFQQERRLASDHDGKQQVFTKGSNLNDFSLRGLLVDFGIKDKLGGIADEDNLYRQIQESFDYICKPHRMGGVIAHQSDGDYQIQFSDGQGGGYTFEGLSSGQRNVLNFLTQYFARRMKNSLVLIDELELFLHPTWQQRIMRNLLRINDGNQFIIATHSPTIRQAVWSHSVIDLGKLDEEPHYQLPEDEDQLEFEA
jgi:predicted ATPase